MIYFIPAWYEGRGWTEREQVWYIPGKAAEFDDTVKQVQLFSRGHLFPYQIMLLSYAPNFRHFLHRQSIFRANYWSAFDAIQCIRRKSPAVVSFHDLVWPEDVEFVYSRFAVLAFRNGQKYAMVDFGEGGNMIQVTMYGEDGKVSRLNIYDDRGFLSVTVVYRAGEPLYEQYLDEAGIWKITCFIGDGHVEVNPKNAEFFIKDGMTAFQKMRYDSLEEVLYEVCQSFLTDSGEEDIFVAAMHEQHTKLLANLLKGRHTVLSFFQDRMKPVQNRVMQQFLDGADYIVADTKENVRRIEKRMDRHYPRITAITPFDSRVDHEVSLEFPVQNVMIVVDDLEKNFLEKMLKTAGSYASGKKKILLHFFTRKSGWNVSEELKKKINEVWKKMVETPPAFEVDQCLGAMAVNRKMRESRLLVDLRPIPDQFMQITAMSMGIPQITQVETQYLINGRNGHAIKSLEELPKWMDYYLGDLAHWNDARIAAYEMSSEFSTQEIRKRWEDVIRQVEDGS